MFLLQKEIFCYIIHKPFLQLEASLQDWLSIDSKEETVHDTHYTGKIGLGITIGVLFVLLYILIVFIGWTGVFIQQHRKLRALGNK